MKRVANWWKNKSIDNWRNITLLWGEHGPLFYSARTE